MKEMLNTVSNFFRGLAALVIAVLLAIGSWFGYDAYSSHSRLDEQYKQSQAELAKRSAEIVQLNKDLTEKQRELDASPRR